MQEAQEEKEGIAKALKALREGSKKRNFSQTIDLIVNLKHFDAKKAENKINEILALPNGRAKQSKVVVFSDTAKSDEFTVVKSDEISRLAGDKKGAKMLAKETDFFLAEPKLMPLIGKSLGQILAPQGKMPALMTGDAKKAVENYVKSVRIRIKDSPVVQCPVGAEDMEDGKIAENVESVLRFLERRLPKGKNSIAKVFVKMTMSKPVKVESKQG
jgi:large subunit ribosomal protein L1